MTTRHLVDPELDAFLDQLPTIPMTAETLPQIRAALNEMITQQAAALPGSPDIEVREQFVTGPEGAPNVRVLVYLPQSAPRPMPGLVWIHGGGYVIGTPEGDDARAKQFVQEVGCAVVSVDYRLSPETPFPGGVEDCYAALKWLQGHASELGVDSGRLAIGGASAGGGLAAALGLLTRDRAEVPLAFQLLIFPMLDDRTTTTADPHPCTGEFIWTPQHNHFGWSALLGRDPGSEGISPYAAAARAQNLEGLPPTYVSVGSLDLFVEEDLEYARRLIRAGVPTELHLYPGAYHGYVLAPNAWMTRAEALNSHAALRRALRPRTAVGD